MSQLSSAVLSAGLQLAELGGVRFLGYSGTRGGFNGASFIKPVLKLMVWIFGSLAEEFEIAIARHASVRRLCS